MNKIEELLTKPLHIFSHFTNENTLNSCLEQANPPLFKKIETIKPLKHILFELNSHIKVVDVLSKLYEIEANIHILESALNGFEKYSYGEIEEFNTHFKSVNACNKKALKEVFVMLEGKRFTPKQT